MTFPIGHGAWSPQKLKKVDRYEGKDTQRIHQECLPPRTAQTRRPLLIHTTHTPRTLKKQKTTQTPFFLQGATGIISGSLREGTTLGPLVLFSTLIENKNYHTGEPSFP